MDKQNFRAAPTESSSSIEPRVTRESETLSPTTTHRLDDQIAWYDKKSVAAQRAYKSIKLVQIAIAAAVPLVAVSNLTEPSRITAVLGLLMLVLEGIQQMNQYQENWIRYRSTCEALKHEKYTCLAGAGPYAKASDTNAVLADRIEGLISQEHAKWVSTLSNEKSADRSTPIK
ncbi:DUF4231 domain-containing protein [Paraburkholderia strydomiana]